MANTDVANAYYRRLETIQAFINALNTKFIHNETVAQLLVREVDGARMLSKYWDPAFTHVTFNPSSGKNYEVLENIGDAQLDAQFTTYLTHRLPEGSELLFTEIGNFYTGNEYLATLSDELKLPSILQFRGPPAATPGMKADIVESYIGALHMAGNALVDGFGSALVYDFIVYLFKNVDLDIQKGTGAPRTNTEQIFTRFGLEPPRPQVIKEGNLTVSYVYLEPKNVEFIRHFQFNIPMNTDRVLIGRGMNKYKDIAVAQSFAAALEYLAKIGVTPKWAEDLKNSQEMSAPEVINYVAAAARKASARGFRTMYFSSPSKSNTPDDFVMLLVGVRDDGTRDVIHSKYFELGAQRQKISREHALARGVVIQEYAENDKLI